MKTDDIVRVEDPSYSLLTDGDGGAPARADRGQIEGRDWRVIVTDCVMPISNRGQEPNVPPNDTILVEVDCPAHVLLTQQRFCTVPSPEPPPENMTVDIPEGTERVIFACNHPIAIYFENRTVAGSPKGGAECGAEGSD